MTTRTVTPVTGQLELDYDAPELTPGQRAALAAHVVAGWQTEAYCVHRPGEPWLRLHPDVWFPDLTATEVRDTALTWCYDCPVRRSCLAFALSNGDEYGIWGGTTEIQRYDLQALVADGMPVANVLDTGLTAAREAAREAARRLPRSDDDDDWGYVA